MAPSIFTSLLISALLLGHYFFATAQESPADDTSIRGAVSFFCIVCRALNLLCSDAFQWSLFLAEHFTIRSQYNSPVRASGLARW